MGEFRRGCDGRRLFTTEFKREQISRVLRGELTLAELARELDVHASVVRDWKRRFHEGATVALEAQSEVVPASALREAERRIRELERALGRKTMEVEILQAAREEVKKRPSYYGVSTPKPGTR